MRLLILAFCGLLLIGSTAAFLLYVSLLSILSVVLILTAAMFMFLLGVHVERQRTRIPENVAGRALPRVYGLNSSLDARGRSITTI